jgi:hypothetical protein
MASRSSVTRGVYSGRPKRLKPDTDLKMLYQEAEEAMEGVIVNLKLWEEES